MGVLNGITSLLEAALLCGLVALREGIKVVLACLGVARVCAEAVIELLLVVCARPRHLRLLLLLLLLATLLLLLRPLPVVATAAHHATHGTYRLHGTNRKHIGT